MKPLLLAAVLFTAPTFVAEAFDWTPKSSAEERAAFVSRAREAGENALADRVAALDDAAWIDAAIRGAEDLLFRTEDLDSFDAKRRAALELFDYPLHVDNYAQTTDPKVRTAFEESAIASARRAIVRVRDEVRAATVAPGTLRAWHVYNMAYVLKGSRHTVLVDFTPYPFAKGCAAWTDEDWDAFAELGDLLVITHPHRDHLSIPLIRRMQAKGKPVVLPCAITNVTAVVLDSDHAEPVNVAGVAIRNFCGFQGDVPCNSYNLEIDGVTVADNGDNSDINKDALQMDCPPADLIIAATWNRPMFFVKSCMLARGFRRDRAVFLPSHDNELMHSVPHRESYHELYASDRRLGAPDFTWPTTKVLAWGESITVGTATGAVCAALPAKAGEDGRTGLRVRFLGTGAADWNGRDARGELRRCTSVLLDDRVLIDLTEPALEMIPAAARPEAILYTHSHGDHFDPAAALKAGVRRAYVHESWLADARKRLDPSIEVVPLKIGVPVEVGGIRFTSCPANHATRLPGEQTTMYFVEKGETRLLYATDTSGIPAVAARIAGIDAHVPDSKGITALIMEATMGVEHADDSRLFAHSSVATVAQVARVLKMTDRYHPRFPDQKIYLTHMARTLHGTQKEIEKSVPDPLCPAFDGLEIVL